VVFLNAQEPQCHLPSRECEQQIRQMLSGRRYLGATIVDLKPGIVIRAILPDSPAAKAQPPLRAGDRFIAVNGHSLENASASEFKEVLAEARQTGKLWMIVQRRGAYTKVEGRLEPYPKEYIDKIVSAHLQQAHTATASGQ
jgi:C-terminal processing protease CtpA/Prc